jgi:hypothetical protein
MRTLRREINRYRTLEVQLINFPNNVRKFEFYGYVKNDGVSKMKGITIYNFDTISYLSTSEKGFYHCVGLNGKILTQIILINNQILWK